MARVTNSPFILHGKVRCVELLITLSITEHQVELKPQKSREPPMHRSAVKAQERCLTECAKYAGCKSIAPVTRVSAPILLRGAHTDSTRCWE